MSKINLFDIAIAKSSFYGISDSVHITIISHLLAIMQQKNSQMVKKILTDLVELFNVKGLRGLAEFIDTPTTRVYAWVRNGRITDTGLLLAKKPEINIDWLISGKGPMLNVQSTKIAAAIEPGNQETKNNLLANRSRPTIVQDHLRFIVEWMDGYYGKHPDQSVLFYEDLKERYSSFQKFIEKKSALQGASHKLQENKTVNSE